MMYFCATGTCAASISTPRSPRATITASVASTIASRLCSACGFSILLITGIPPATPPPRAAHIPSRRIFRLFTSSAVRTKLSARKSTPCSTAHSTHAQSRSVIAGTFRSDSGRLMPLRLVIRPPTVTRHSRLSPSRRSTASVRIAPSLISTRCPGSTSLKIRSNVVPNTGTPSSTTASPWPLRNRMSCPASTQIPPPSSTSGTPSTRIFGPCRSPSTAIGRSTRFAASRTAASRTPASSSVPWLKFSRKIDTPARISLPIVSTESDAGPRVATILAWAGRSTAPGSQAGIAECGFIPGLSVATSALLRAANTSTRTAPAPTAPVYRLAFQRRRHR